MSILPGNKAPWFASIGFQENKFLDISLNDFSISGNWLVLFFYPLDFGYVGPSELLELEARRAELEKLGCKVVAVSTDSVVVHERFASLNRGYGGVHGIKFPLMQDKDGSISRLYGVLKEGGAGHSFRAYFIIDSDQIVRARVVGDLPVALGMDEMVRQVRALKLAVTGVYVDGEGKKISDVEYDYEMADRKKNPGIMQSDSSYYSQEILKVGDSSLAAAGRMQSPVDILTSDVKPDPRLGPLIFSYSGIWSVSNLEDNTLPPVSRQPSLVLNSGFGWRVELPPHHQCLMHGGPLHSANYRLDHYLGHWGSSEHGLDGKFFDGEIQLVHYHIQYDSLADALRHSEAVAIVSILLTKDDKDPNDELEKIGEVLPQIELRGQSAQTAESVELMNLLPEDQTYLTYQGSLTTPPFTEEVVWCLLPQPVSVSSRTLDRMKQLQYGGRESCRMGANCKTVASLGARTVFRPVRGEERN